MTIHQATTPAAPAGQREPGRLADSALIWHAMRDDTSLAKLFRDYRQQREIEKIDRGTEWIAYQRGDDGHLTVIAIRGFQQPAVQSHAGRATRRCGPGYELAAPDHCVMFPGGC